MKSPTKTGKALDKSKEYGIKVVVRGNCMVCGKKLSEGLFLCKECQSKTERSNHVDNS